MAMKKTKISAKVKKVTYFEDFIKKYPDAPINSRGIPDVCLESLGYLKECPYDNQMVPSCRDCWKAIKGTWDNPYRKEVY